MSICPFCSFQYEVKEAIRNISAVITWINFGEELPGTGPNKDTYILNKTVLIYPETKTGMALWFLEDKSSIISITLLCYMNSEK